MIELPRIAFGSVQPQLFLQPLLWGVLDGLRRVGIEGQAFCSQSRFDDLGGLTALDEGRVRHLDSWLMPPEVSRWLLCEGGRQRDLSIVVGRLADAVGGEPSGGSLERLADDLQLPSLVVVDVETLDPCCLPRIPDETLGIVLAGCRGELALARWQTRLESLWGLPVLGGFCDPLRPEIWSDPNGARLGHDQPLIRSLGDDFLRHVRWQRLLQIARQTPGMPNDDPWQSLRELACPLRVAVAYDAAFNCYFPDTMDCLESMGAELIDFSPLKSESLPTGIDLVWFGCGHPEHHAERLAGNICLQQSLRMFVRDGGRVYAEGGGLAYVCETMHCAAGVYPMAGLVPATAHFCAAQARPVDVQLDGRSWLGDRRVRGYLNPCWLLEPHENCIDYSAQSTCPCSLVGREKVIGSRVHLHFASQPHLLRSIWAA